MRKSNQAPALPAHKVRKIACAAEADPRTVYKVINGEPTRHQPRERVERALKAAGLEHLIRTAS